MQGSDAVEWQLLLYKPNCTYSKSSVICAAYFISKAEEKMKEEEGPDLQLNLDIDEQFKLPTSEEIEKENILFICDIHKSCA